MSNIAYDSKSASAEVNGNEWGLAWTWAAGPLPDLGAQRAALRAATHAEKDDALRALAAGLAEEQAELSRMEAELHERVLRMAGLEERLNAVERLTERDLPLRAEAPVDDYRIRGPTLDPRHSPRSLQREYWLCRCEGFEVGSPTGRIGVVEGLRFLSRVDQPDLLEVRTGLFGRRLLLLPVEEVESISSSEERIVLRTAPRPHDDRISELLGRLGSRLRASRMASRTLPEP